MKLKLDKPLLIKLLIIGVLLIVAPFVLPFTLELVLMADMLGLEALLLFLLIQSRSALNALQGRVRLIGANVLQTAVLLADVYMFQPKPFISHATGSSLLLIFSCSSLLAVVLWLPAVYLSIGGFT